MRGTLRFYSSHPLVLKRRKKCPKQDYDAPRGTKKGTPLFLTHKSSAKGIALKTLRKELKELMVEAGLDEIWTVHSCRGATVSKLFNLGFSMKRCQDFGRWHSTSSLEKHYLKRANYKEYSEENNKLPSWELLRCQATPIEEASPA